jgi:hypothetical protein
LLRNFIKDWVCRPADFYESKGLNNTSPKK